MSIRIQIELSHPDFHELSTRVINEANRKGRHAALTWFLKHRMGARFDGSMERQLGWKAQSMAAQSRQRNSKHFAHNAGTRHVFTEMTKDRAEEASIKEPRTGGKMSSIVITGLHEGYGRGKQAKRMRDELSRVAPWEVEVMGRHIKAAMIEHLNEHMGRKRVTKKID